MDSMILILPVDAVNVLVLVPLAEFRLDKCPDPSIWDQVFVNNVDASTDVRTCQVGICLNWFLGLRGFLGLGNVGVQKCVTRMGRMPDRCPGHPLLSLRSRVLPSGTWASRRGRFCLNRGLRRLDMMARTVSSAFTLTPGSSPGQALALSHRGRGDGVLCFSLGSRPRIGVRGRPRGKDGRCWG